MIPSVLAFSTGAALSAAIDGNGTLYANTIVVVNSISATYPRPGKFRFVSGSVSPDNNQSQLVIVPTTNPTGGKWLRCDPVVDLILPISRLLADNTTLVTVPAELTLAPIMAATMLEMTAVWTPGAGSAVGLSFSTPSLNRTKGNLAGGAAGNAGFTSACFYQPTLGSQFAAGLVQAPILCPASLIIYDLYGAAFTAATAGTGNAHVPCLNYFTSIVPVAPP